MPRIMTEDHTSIPLPQCFGRAALQHGFTMIEVMVVVTIVSLVLLFGVPTMSSWMQSSQIRNASESIQSGLQLARNEAVARNDSVQFVLTTVAGGGTASDWTVRCVTPTANCPGVGNVAPAKTEIEKRVAAEGSANVQVATAQPTIVFNGMGRVTPTPAGTIQIDITNPTGGTCAAVGGAMRCLRVMITSGGQSRMCDPALALAANPRGCI
jgi:type IV fimbrial biogenesis protein FimT